MVEASLALLIHPLQAAEYSGESELLAACRRREIRAFEQVYLTHGGRLKSIAWRILGNRSDAEDAVQETFLKLYRGIEAFHAESNLGTWLCRILINACHDLERKRQRDAQPDADPPRLLPELLALAGAERPDPARVGVDTGLDQRHLDPQKELRVECPVAFATDAGVDGVQPPDGSLCPAAITKDQVHRGDQRAAQPGERVVFERRVLGDASGDKWVCDLEQERSRPGAKEHGLAVDAPHH